MAHNLNPIETKKSGVNWKQVGLFVGLTIALSWLIDLVLVLKFGYGQYAVVFFQLQMLIPAFVAILLQRTVFKDSPLHMRTYRGRPRWFLNFYLFFTLLVAALVILITLRPDLYPVPLAGLLMPILVISLIVLLATRIASGKEAFQQAGLSGGKWTSWLLVWLAVMGFNCLNVALNMVAGFGSKSDIGPMAAAAGMDIPTYLIVGFVNTVVVGPLLGLVIAFGEEYGWRGYLQGELTKLGRIKGVLLVGVIWGIWHAPAVVMGHNYPGHPVLGPIAFLVFNLILSILLGYIMLKTGSVWQVAFAHAIINQGYQWLTIMVYAPTDPLFAFGVGLYGIAIAFLISLVVLRDRIWKQANHSSTA